MGSVVAVLVGTVPRAAASASAFTPAQRAELVQIMRQAPKQGASAVYGAVSAMPVDEARAAVKAVGGKHPEPADRFMGNPTADATVVQFFHARCAHCRVMQPTLEDFVTTRRDAKPVFKDLPIPGRATRLDPGRCLRRGVRVRTHRCARR